MIEWQMSRRLAATVVFLGIAGVASAQEYPSRPVRLVMGFGPGGLGDIAGRAIGQVMSQSIGQPVVIENMPGAGGATAALTVARAAPDGHSMLWVSSQNAIPPSMFKSLAYDWSRDFTAVGPMATFDFVLLVHKDSLLQTVRDVIDAAKSNPGKFNFGSIAVGTAQNLSTLNFVSMAGLNVPTVPFRTRARSWRLTTCREYTRPMWRCGARSSRTQRFNPIDQSFPKIRSARGLAM